MNRKRTRSEESEEATNQEAKHRRVEEEEEDGEGNGAEDQMEESVQSDESEEDEEEEEERETVDDGHADRLEVKLLANPYDFETHCEYIRALRVLGDLDRLRKARENMNQMFPLSEELWKSWIEDEISVTTSPEEKRAVLDLYHRANKEYQSVRLWYDYIIFVINLNQENLDTPEAQKDIRNAFENALTNVGLNVSEADKIWSVVQEFENELLKVMEANPQDEKALQQQVEHVRALYRRRLSIPMRFMEDVFNEYAEWETQHGGSITNFEATFQQALKQYEDRKPFEAAIAGEYSPSNPDYVKLPEWQKYIDFELSSGDPSRIICLFERAVKHYFLVVDLWIQYLAFLQTKMKSVHNVILDTYSRALRNCPWSGSLWAGYIRALERAKKPKEEISAAFEKGLTSGLQTSQDYCQVFQSYIDCLARPLKAIQDRAQLEKEAEPVREVFARALAYLDQYVPESDETLQMHLLASGFEARCFRNIEKAREQFETTVKKFGRYYQLWSEYATFERYLGDISKCRSVFKRACNGVRDFPEKLFQDWLNFERVEGTLDDFSLALERCTAKQKEIQTQREREAEKEAQLQAKQAAKEAKKNAKQAKQTIKRKILEKQIEMTEGKEEETVTKEEALPPGKPRKEKKIIDHSHDSRTAFIVNLPFSITEQHLQELFSQFGTINQVRLVKSKEGKSKGFAYVEFATEESANKSLVLDQTELGGRTLKVSISSPPAKKNRDLPESHTIFISNLAPTATEEDLLQVFTPCGQIKDVRLVKTRKTGLPKGFAYIDFAEEFGVLNALKHNQTLLKAQIITVARSDPTRKSSADSAPKTSKKSEADKEGFKVPSAPKARGNFLTPRALRQKTDTAAPTQETAKSNADFRKQFLG